MNIRNIKKSKNKKVPVNEVEFFNDALLSDAIHKLKNGLGGIHGFAALLERDFEPNDPHMKMVMKIQDAVSKVNDVSTSLMLVVRDHDVTIDEFRITTLLKQMWGSFQREDDPVTADLIIDPSFTAQKSIIKADSQLIERMLASVYNFIESISGKMERVSLQGGKWKHILIKFYYSPAQEDTNDTFSDYLSTLHHVEPRLFLAIINKVVMLHKGSFTLDTEEGHKVISIKLPKGFKA